MLDVITELTALVEAVDDRDVRRVAMRFTPIGRADKVLGAVHNDEARKWWAMSHKLKANSDRAEHKAQFEAENDEQRAEYEHQAMRWHYLSSVAKEVFWFQVREDVGGSAWGRDLNVGLRDGWTLVARPTMSHLPHGLAHLLGALGGQLGGSGGDTGIDFTVLPGIGGGDPEETDHDADDDEPGS